MKYYYKQIFQLPLFQSTYKFYINLLLKMLPYLIYVILATKRYLHFENVGTFNIRWHLKWFTKLKIFLSLAMAILNTYEFIQYNYGGISEILMILIEVAVWLSYGPVLIFDLKRALHHDWSFHYPFHITLLASALYLLLTTMIANQTQQSATDQQLNLLLIVEACLQLIFLLIVVWKPKDFPYSNRMKKMSMSLIPKKEYLSFSKLSAGLSMFSPKDQSENKSIINKQSNFSITTQKKQPQQEYIITCDIVSFKVQDGRLVFQIVSKLNGRPLSRINRSLDEFSQQIGIEVEVLEQKQTLHEQAQQFQAVMEDLQQQLRDKLLNFAINYIQSILDFILYLNEPLTDTLLTFLGIKESQMPKLIQYQSHQLCLQLLQKQSHQLNKSLKQTLRFLTTQRQIHLEKVDLINDMGFNLYVGEEIIYIGRNQGLQNGGSLEVDNINETPSGDGDQQIFNENEIFEEYMQVFNDITLIGDYQLQLFKIKIIINRLLQKGQIQEQIEFQLQLEGTQVYSKLYELQQTLNMHKTLITQTFKVFRISQIGMQLQEILEGKIQLELQLKVEFADLFKLDKTYKLLKILYKLALKFYHKYSL